MKSIRIVIGGNFGDEGKGLMTDYFTREMIKHGGLCLNVLSNGGAQRGHTVVSVLSPESSGSGGERVIRHVYRHFGSGTIAGADTYFPPEFILNPMIFMKEYLELEGVFPGILGRKDCETAGKDPERNTRYPIRVYVHPDCRVTTPFEMLTNRILEEHRGLHRHGSVGVGIWETVIGGGKTYGQLTKMTRRQREEYLAADRKQHMYDRLHGQGIDTALGDWQELAEDPGLIRHYLDDLEQMQSLLLPADDFVLQKYDHIVFENGQGLLLDQSMLRKGFGHHTTPSNTGISNPLRMIRDALLPAEKMLCIEAVYVTRSYMTRHGAGRFDTECPKEQINSKMRDQTNQPNESQGSLRYGTLNPVSLQRRVHRDFHLLEEELKEEIRNGRVRAEVSVAMTHLNEFASPGRSIRELKYKSFAEIGENCVILA